MASGTRTEVGYLRMKSAKSCSASSWEILKFRMAVSKSTDSRLSAASTHPALKPSANRIRNTRIKRTMRGNCNGTERVAKRGKSHFDKTEFHAEAGIGAVSNTERK